MPAVPSSRHKNALREKSGPFPTNWIYLSETYGTRREPGNRILIEKGQNYGWPWTVGAPGIKGFKVPLMLFPDLHLPPAADDDRIMRLVPAD